VGGGPGGGGGRPVWTKGGSIQRFENAASHLKMGQESISEKKIRPKMWVSGEARYFTKRWSKMLKGENDRSN